MFKSLAVNTGERQVLLEDLKEFVKQSAIEVRDELLFKQDVRGALISLLQTDCVRRLIIHASRSDVYGDEMAAKYSVSKDSLYLLRRVKILKYSYNIPAGQLVACLTLVVGILDESRKSAWLKFEERVMKSDEVSTIAKELMLAKQGDAASLRELYLDNAEWLEVNDPHAIFPTSIYRQCSGHISSSEDSKVIEGVMGTTVTTTIEIVRDVLSPESHQLRDIFKPLKRCIAVIDKRVDGLFGDAVSAYFAAHEIRLVKLVYSAMEVDKDISSVEQILADLKANKVSRNEPVLIMGGGVIADVGGFACALYHRNTPYVMLNTSIVSGIDAGPSPRTCCDGHGYKNLFGAYHPPVLTLTDRSFFKTLHKGWIRHGIAEIIKMALVKDFELFKLVEEGGVQLVDTFFGVIDCERGSRIDELSDLILAKAMDCYVRSEYGNLWETHQARPHAYGHTWSPGFELQAGLLHGHAVACGMGYGAYLSFHEGWITEEEMHRALRLMSTVGLSIYHPCLDVYEHLWSATVKAKEKRGGNLCAPIPRGSLGKCGYLNDMPREKLEKTLAAYKEVCRSYPREGLGIEPHCADVGLEDPSTVKKHADSAVKINGVAADPAPAAATVNRHATDTEYNEWLVSQQEDRNRGLTSSRLCANLAVEIAPDQPSAPKFANSTLFHDGAEEYAMEMTSIATADIRRIADMTQEKAMFSPCMVGQIEGQFLKMVCKISGAKRVLDVGTFTGNSAMAFAEGMGPDGRVVTIENNESYAEVARSCFEQSKQAAKIHLRVGDAKQIVKELAEAGEKFDVVFLDADKVNYAYYYEHALQMLAENGVLMADNALCSLVYKEDDPARQKLHEFANLVKNDVRVEQVMLTVREGILLVQKL